MRLGYDFAKKHFTCPLPFSLKRLNKTSNHILIDGNTAFALGAVYAGATVGAWYPITPSTSLMDAFKMFCEQYRTTPEGEKKFIIIQAEDELAAAGMVIGANWAGARAFTSTAGPGISLMQEFIGLAYYAEIPAVFVDVQRVGPSTGMPTRTQQGDLFSCAYASHGDTKHICIYPSDPEGMLRDGAGARSISPSGSRRPCSCVTDLDIGMNDWMVPRLTWDDDYRPDRGKVLTAEDLAKVEKWGRYQDTGGGVPSRTLPGTGGKGAFFTRGSGHNLNAAYTEDSPRVPGGARPHRAQDADGGERRAQAGRSSGTGSEIGIVALGGTNGAVLEARRAAEARRASRADYMRIRGFPFGDEVDAFMKSHERMFVVEQNRDAQLRAMLAHRAGVPRDDMTAVLDYAGLPLTAQGRGGRGRAVSVQQGSESSHDDASPNRRSSIRASRRTRSA